MRRADQGPHRHFLAEQSVRLVREDSGDFTVVSEADAQTWAQADPVCRAAGQALGITDTGRAFKADGTVSAGEELQSARSAVDTAVKIWGVQSGAIQRTVPSSRWAAAWCS